MEMLVSGFAPNHGRTLQRFVTFKGRSGHLRFQRSHKFFGHVESWR